MTYTRRTLGLWLLCGLCVQSTSADLLRQHDGSEQAGSLVEVKDKGVVFSATGAAAGQNTTVPFRDLNAIHFRGSEWDPQQAKVVVDTRKPPANTESSGTIKLRAGMHHLGLAYWQAEGPSNLTVEYAGPGIKRAKLPPNALFREGANGKSVPHGEGIDPEGFFVKDEYSPLESGLAVRVHEWTPGTEVLDLGDLKGVRVARYTNSRTLDLGAFKHAKSNFGVVLSGFVQVPTDGEYTFFMKSSGRAVLWIGRDPNQIHPGSPNLLADDYTVTSVDGGAWWGKLGEWTPDKLVINVPLAGQTHPVEAPVEMLHEIWTTPVVLQELKVDRAQEPASLDSVYVKGPDGKTIQRVSGKSFGREGDSLQFEHEGEKRSLKMDRVVGVVFHSRRAAPLSSPGLLTVSGGHQFPGELVQAKRHDKVVFQTLWGQEMTWPYDRVVRLDVRNGRSQWLADLQPSSEELIPFFDRTLTWTSNKALGGAPLQIEEKVYSSGICVHSKTVLTYDLHGEYNQFQSDLGLQHDTGSLGNVDVWVLLDGKEIYQKTGLNQAAGKQAVSVDLTGGQTLTLEVDFGEDQDVGDHVTWGDAKLRKGTP